MLSDADKYFLTVALRENKGFHLAAEWYFGMKPMPKQYAYHQALQKNITWVGGIASGKSKGVSVSVPLDCMTLPGFKSLSTSITSVQAEIPFEMFLAVLDTEPYKRRLEPHIDDIKRRPYPEIRFTNGSSWLFRTAGIQATHIRGLEFDRIVFDEAAYERDEATMQALRGRLRGQRQSGIPRMARLDAVSSPAHNVWMRRWFERGNPHSLEPQLNKFLSIRSSIYDNPHITPEQIELMEADYPDDLIDVELKGHFPDHGETLFPASHVEACEDRSLNEEMDTAVRENKPGYRHVYHPRHGTTHFERPAIPGRSYVMAGDPGIGDVPRRNAACVMVFDAQSLDMVYLNWISGNGSYMPFLNAFKYAKSKYHPLLSGIDATGTQRALDELAFQQHGIETDPINFNRDKDGMINTLSLMLTGHKFRYPFIKGLLNQLIRYRREDRKLDNDLVVTLAMIAWLTRYIDGDADLGHAPARKLTRKRNQRVSNRHGRYGRKR